MWKQKFFSVSEVKNHGSEGCAGDSSRIQPGNDAFVGVRSKKGSQQQCSVPDAVYMKRQLLLELRYSGHLMQNQDGEKKRKRKKKRRKEEYSDTTAVAEKKEKE